MEIKKAEELVRGFLEEKNWTPKTKEERTAAMIHLMEEIGEFAREILYKEHGRDEITPRDIDVNDSLSEELADVFYMVLKMAIIYEVDLEKAFLDKFAKIKKKFSHV